MQKSKSKASLAVFGTLRVMVISAMFCAMSVVIGIFCKNFLNFGNGLFRITFEGLPIVLSGIMFGPLVGGLVGAATDIVSYFLSAQMYPLNPVVTLGCAAIGIISGVVSRYIIKKSGYLQISVSVLLSHLIGSVVIKSVGLFAFYSWAVLWRIPIYTVIAGVELLIICMLYKNRAFRKLMTDVGDRK